MTTHSTPSWPGEVRYLQTGDVVVDLSHRRLQGEGVEGELPQRVFDLLLLFMAEPEVLHSRDELFERLWPKTVVEDANLTQSIWLLRRALGESRKHWVRTVAKGGYIFEPPTPVRALDATELPLAAPPAAHDATVTIDRLRNRIWLTGGLLVLGLLAAGTWWWRQPGDSDALPPPGQVAIALIDVNESGSGASWPAVLLHEWLKWKLDSLPEVSLLTEADLATRTDPTPPVVVFLSAGPIPEVPGRLRLQARFEEDGRVQRVETDGDASDVSTMAQTLSDQILRRLVSARRASWPPLELDAATAEHYAAGVAAYRSRDWMQAVPILQEVTQQAPRFGLAHLQLARALSHLSDQGGARTHIGIARELLQPAPAEAIAALDADVLATRPEQAAEAAAAFAQLARQYPSKPEYLLRQSYLEYEDSRPQQALATIQARDWNQEPLEIRLRHHLQLANIHRVLGNLKQARTEAAAAAAQAEAAGANWTLEHALARIEDGRAALQLGQPDAAISAFQQAETLFEDAGNQTGQLYARFMASISGGAESTEMDALLVKARAGGNRRLEMEILLREAARHHSQGDLDDYRRRMHELLASAEAADDRLRRDQFELLLLNEDIHTLDMAAARKRLAHLREASLKGGPGVIVVKLDAAMHALNGDFMGALESLDKASRQLVPNPATPGDATLLAQLACVRAPLMLELGNLSEAREEWRACSSQDAGTVQVDALLGRATTEWMAGDARESRILRKRAEAALSQEPGGPDRWHRKLALANLHLHAGEAEPATRAASEVLAQVRGTGYDLIEAHSVTVLAEAAAMRGDWSIARQHADEARELLPESIWPLRWRVDLLDAMAAKTAGERGAAVAIADKLHRRASANGNVLALLTLHARLPGDLPPDCTQEHRDALVARSGLRGATYNPYPFEDSRRAGNALR